MSLRLYGRNNAIIAIEKEIKANQAWDEKCKEFTAEALTMFLIL
jgi:hypothetical protein